MGQKPLAFTISKPGGGVHDRPCPHGNLIGELQASVEPSVIPPLLPPEEEVQNHATDGEEDDEQGP